ncbi:hypothetical protein GCM10011428_39450 [Streptomyces violaceus]
MAAAEEGVDVGWEAARGHDDRRAGAEVGGEGGAVEGEGAGSFLAEGGEVVHVDVAQAQSGVFGAEPPGEGGQAFGGKVAGGGEDQVGFAGTGLAEVGPDGDAVAQFLAEGVQRVLDGGVLASDDERASVELAQGEGEGGGGARGVGGRQDVDGGIGRGQQRRGEAGVLVGEGVVPAEAGEQVDDAGQRG